MSRFEILPIGEEVEPTDGIPDGCDLCGHCTMLRRVLPDGAPLPCGAARRWTPRAARPDDFHRATRQPPPRTPQRATRGATR